MINDWLLTCWMIRNFPDIFATNTMETISNDRVYGNMSNAVKC